MKLLSLFLAATMTACSSVPTRQPTVEAAIAGALSTNYALASPPVFVSDPAHCTSPTFAQAATIRAEALNEVTFPSRFPKGVFVVCDPKESRDAATARVQRLLFHGASKTVKIAEQGDMTLRRGRNGWNVVRWERVAVDY
jgi:hypothetical protein